MRQRNGRKGATWLASAALVLAMGGCGSEPASEVDNVFGPDNREAPQDSGPYRAVGRLDSGCTGTIIGKRLVLTAAHCVFDSATGTVKPEVRYFRPNLRNGTSADPAWIEFAWLGTNQPEEQRAHDWAILRVSRDVGAKYGTIAIRAADFAALPYTVSQVGYSTDRDNGNTASIHRGCYVHKVVDGKLFNDCDGMSGVSGGPLLDTVNGNPYIVGIAVSEYRQGAPGSVRRDQYSEDYTNVAVPASTFSDVATQIIKNVDGGTSVPPFDGVVEVVNPNDRTRDPRPNPDRPDPDQPDPTPQPAHDVVPADTLMRREGQVLQAMRGITESGRALCDLGRSLGNVAVLKAGEDLLDAAGTFDDEMTAFVNGRMRQDYATRIGKGYAGVVADVDATFRLESSTLPPRAASDLERSRGELRQLVQRLNSLILIERRD